MLTIRIDILEDSIRDRVKEFLEKFLFPQYLIVEEVARQTKKKHYQGIIDIGNHPEKTIRNYIVRNILKGYESKGKYSFSTVKDLDSYMIYILKGDEDNTDNLDIQYQQGFTEEVIEGYKAKATDTQKEFKERGLKRRSSKAPTFAHKFLEYIESNKDIFIRNGVIHRTELLELTIDFFGQETKKFRAFLIEEFYNLAEYHYSPHTLKHRIMKEITDRISFHNLSPINISNNAYNQKEKEFFPKEETNDTQV